jgi:1,4-dihydroxy-2-naphthoate octaprenyltransferase
VRQSLIAARISMMWHLLAAARPVFLTGGVAVYMLGVVVAWHETGAAKARPLVAGLAVVLLGQLMTDLLNEYWDQEGDALITRRTFFSGGSGALQSGALSAATVYRAALACGLAEILLTLSLGLRGNLSAVSALVIALAVAGGMLYSQPPPRLVARGLGEVTVAGVVCFLAPALGYSLQTGGLSILLVATCLPAMIIVFAMLLAVELPDFDADVATGKRNLVVRLGRGRVARLYAVAVAACYVASVAGLRLGVPAPVALVPVMTAPFAVVEIRLVREAARGDLARAPLMTFLGSALFAALCLLQIVGYIM